jgi:hypothetical protein
LGGPCQLDDWLSTASQVLQHRIKHLEPVLQAVEQVVDSSLDTASWRVSVS